MDGHDQVWRKVTTFGQHSFPNNEFQAFVNLVEKAASPILRYEFSGGYVGLCSTLRSLRELIISNGGEFGGVDELDETSRILVIGEASDSAEISSGLIAGLTSIAEYIAFVTAAPHPSIENATTKATSMRFEKNSEFLGVLKLNEVEPVSLVRPLSAKLPEAPDTLEKRSSWFKRHVTDD